MFNLDGWLANGIFFQAGVLLCLCYMLNKPSPRKVSNLPLALMTLWVGLSTLGWWYVGLLSNRYNFPILMPFLNFLTFVIFYKAIIDYLQEWDVQKIYTYLQYVVLGVLIYCILQYFNLDQFYRHIDKNIKTDSLVGFIGNKTHLAAWIGIFMPVLYLKRTKLSLVTIALAWGIIALTGASAGLLTAICATIFFHIFQNYHKRVDVLVFILATLALLYVKDFNISEYLNPNKRFEYWQYIYPYFQQKAILGTGMGFLNALSAKLVNTPLITFKHAHFELYHFAVELGVVGVGCILYGIIDYFRRFIKVRHSKLAVIAASIFVGFLANSMLNFTAHIWALSIGGMVGYSFLYVIKEV